jgi:hypothetical protein
MGNHTLPVPTLSPGNLSSSPASPLGPQSAPSQEEQSCVAFASMSLSSLEDPFNSWIPPSLHPNSEATFGNAAVDKGCIPEDDGWPTAGAEQPEYTGRHVQAGHHWAFVQYELDRNHDCQWHVPPP